MAFPNNPTEEALQAAMQDPENPERIGEFFGALVSGQLWVPLPEGAGPQDDGTFAMPTLEFQEDENAETQQLIPAFTSPEQFAAGAPEGVEQIVLPAAEMIQQCPDTVGLAINPGCEEGMPIPPEGVQMLAQDFAGETRITIDHPATEPTELLTEIGKALTPVSQVVSASRAWIDVENAGEGLIIGVELDDPQDEQAQQLAISAVERVVNEVEPGFSLDVTFVDLVEDDPIDEWLLDNTEPFYSRA